MSEKPPPLPDDLRDLLDAERDLDAPPAEVRERMFARLAPFVLPGAGGGGTSGPGTAGHGGGGAGPTLPHGGAVGSGAAGASAAWHAKVLIAVVSASLGAAGGAATHAWLAPPPHAALTRPPSSAVTVAPPPPALPVPPDASAEAVPEERMHERTPQRKALPTHLRAERLLVETANAALVRGDYASALATLRAHAAKYPRGVLAEEREVMMVQALAASGDHAAAKQRARAFKRSFPGSLQQGAVDKAAE